MPITQFIILALFLSFPVLAEEKNCDSLSVPITGEDDFKKIIGHVNYKGSCIDSWNKKIDSSWKEKLDDKLEALSGEIAKKDELSEHLSDLSLKDFPAFIIAQFPDPQFRDEIKSKLTKYHKLRQSCSTLTQDYKNITPDPKNSEFQKKVNNCYGISQDEKPPIFPNQFKSYDDFSFWLLTHNEKANQALKNFQKKLAELESKSLSLKVEKAKKDLKKIGIKKMCGQNANFSIIPQNGFKTSRALTTSDGEDAFKKLSQKILSLESQKHENSKFFCSPITEHYSLLQPVENKLEIELKGTTFFNDNEFALNERQKNGIDAAVSEKLKSLTTGNCKGVIKDVQIISSSSLLRNRIVINGEVDEKKSWDFKGLSNARAYSIGNHLVEKYKISKKIIHPYTNGSNGDGSSGPCPYKMDDNKNVYVDKTIDLEPYRYAKASIEFEQVGSGCKKNEKERPVKTQHYRSKCFRVTLNCTEDSY